MAWRATSNRNAASKLLQSQTNITIADEAGIVATAQTLRAGGLAAFPTETVYGLGADAFNDRAVARIFEAKGRPRFNPLILHLRDADHARQFVEWSDRAEILASAFWPGPLTLVLPLRGCAGVSPLVSAGLQTAAIRVPAHPVAQKLLRALGRPLAAPSANPSGRVSPTTAQHVIDGLSGEIETVLDAGLCDVGLESTIVGLAGHATLLRPGGLPAEAVENALGEALHAASGGVEAPGQLASHYAPNAALRLNVNEPAPNERWLGFGPVNSDLNLSPSGDLVEAAANLFRHLHAMDAKGDDPIAVSPIPEKGLGRAINDRLRRAAAPRNT